MFLLNHYFFCTLNCTLYFYSKVLFLIFNVNEFDKSTLEVCLKWIRPLFRSMCSGTTLPQACIGETSFVEKRIGLSLSPSSREQASNNFYSLKSQICIHPPSLFQHPQIVLWDHWTDAKYMTSWREYNENDPIFKHECFRMLFHDEARAGRLLGQGHLLHQRLHPHHRPRRVVLQIRTRRKKRWSLQNLNICSGTSCWQKLKKIEIF